MQYLILGYAHRHPELTDNVGNIALLGRCNALGLIVPHLAQQVADSYRELRRMQHRAWLDGRGDARVEFEHAEPYAKPVVELWQRLVANPA